MVRTSKIGRIAHELRACAQDCVRDRQGKMAGEGEAPNVNMTEAYVPLRIEVISLIPILYFAQTRLLRLKERILSR